MFHQYTIVFGLSPHVRGTANVVVVGDDALRITPCVWDRFLLDGQGKFNGGSPLRVRGSTTLATSG